jgi:hypothetical protein
MHRIGRGSNPLWQINPSRKNRIVLLEIPAHVHGLLPREPPRASRSCDADRKGAAENHSLEEIIGRKKAQKWEQA